MFAVYAESFSPDDPLSGLAVGIAARGRHVEANPDAKYTRAPGIRTEHPEIELGLPSAAVMERKDMTVRARVEAVAPEQLRSRLPGAVARFDDAARGALFVERRQQ